MKFARSCWPVFWFTGTRTIDGAQHCCLGYIFENMEIIVGIGKTWDEACASGQRMGIIKKLKVDDV